MASWELEKWEFPVPRSAFLLTMLLVAAFSFAADKRPDPHLVCSCTAALARRSAFVHGYLHGYEDGFHLADMDIQTGRLPRDISKSKEVKDTGYRHDFGEKQSFKRGYNEGLRVGYGDGVAGRVFRAVAEMKRLLSLAPQEDTGSVDSNFDHGFLMGYFAGQDLGIDDGRRNVNAAPRLPNCPSTLPNTGDPHSFCSAYIGGYRLGYADGFINVSRSGTVQVEARESRE